MTNRKANRVRDLPWPSPAQRIAALSDFEQHLGKTGAKANRCCSSCGNKSDLRAIAGQLVPVRYFLCRACTEVQS